MQFGLFMMHLHPPERSFTESYDRDLAQIVWADRLGYHDIFVAETSVLARERARQVLGRNYVRHQLPNRYGSSQMAATKIDPSMPDDAVDVDYMMEHMWIVGDPQECADRIRQLYETVGGFGMLLAITQDSDNPEWDHRSLQLLMEEVGPRVADLGRG